MSTTMANSETLRGDMPVGNWIDRLVPAPARPYLRLMRLDRPIGSWLLLLPGWWSIALAARHWPDLRLAALFAVGAVVMRGAGCVINDIADRDIDAKVARTALRPIPSGAISVRQALLLLAVLLTTGLAILVQFDRPAIILGAASLLLVIPYPWMKRITYWPQAWLGLTFNCGALLGWVAVTGAIAVPALLLYGAGLFWTLGYDTIYAHQDKEDDALAGVKSTALRLGSATPVWLALFYGLAVALIAAAGAATNAGPGFWLGLALAATQLLWQVRRLDIDDSGDCLTKFKSNRLFGLLILAAILAGKLT
jgi:4-hydroxybenzoate polyprenyltransferase